MHVRQRILPIAIATVMGIGALGIADTNSSDIVNVRVTIGSVLGVYTSEATVTFSPTSDNIINGDVINGNSDPEITYTVFANRGASWILNIKGNGDFTAGQDSTFTLGALEFNGSTGDDGAWIDVSTVDQSTEVGIGTVDGATDDWRFNCADIQNDVPYADVYETTVTYTVISP